MNMRVFTITLLPLFAGCEPPQNVVPVTPEGAIIAEVTRVIDGDTIVIMREGKEQAIRLDGVDCPETRGSGGQPSGDEAKQFVSDWCLDRDVQIVQTGKSWDRWVAYVYRDSDGQFLNHELLRRGLAWHACRVYRRYINRKTQTPIPRIEALQTVKIMYSKP